MRKFLALDLMAIAAGVAGYIATWHHSVWWMVASGTVSLFIAIAKD